DSQLSSATATRGETFTAVLDQPIVFGGQVLAERGCQVVGKVLAVRPARDSGAGYLRVTLTRIVVNGTVLALKTSSLFAKGDVAEVPRTPEGDAAESTMQLVKDGEPGAPTQFTRGRPSTLKAQRDADLRPDQRLRFRIASVVPLAG